MADLVVIVPSRGRPEKVRPLAEVVNSTRTASTELVFSIDSTDPSHADYSAAVAECRGVTLVVGDNANMVEALNRAALGVSARAVGFLGDDHMPSGDWDQPVLDALDLLVTGMVYGDDGIQGERLPTAIFMTTDIIHALGHMAPPVLSHLYVDNAWLDLGKAAKCINYLSHVKIGHRHPVAGLAAWDEGYARCNSQQQYQRDGAAYQRWRATEFPAAVVRVRDLRQTSIASGQKSTGPVA